MIEEERLVNQLENKTIINSPVVHLPNTSGDHIRGLKTNTPSAATDLVNKSYVDSAIAAITTHTRLHSIIDTLDHSSTATNGQLLKANANGLPVNATNTDAEVATIVTAGACDVDANLSVAAQAAISASHARQHSITSTNDHTSTATSGRMLKADTNGLPVDATNTDVEVAAAVTASAVGLTNNDLLDQQIQEIEVLENQAADSMTHLTKNLLISDTCSDTGGYLNTITVGGATTATFDTNKYKRANSASLASPNMNHVDGYAGTSMKYKLTYGGANNFKITKIWGYGGATSGDATFYLKDSTETTTYNTWTLTTTGEGNLVSTTISDCVSLSPATDYIIVITCASSVLRRDSKEAYDTTTNSMRIRNTTEYMPSDNKNAAKQYFDFSEVLSTTQIVDVSIGTIAGTVTHTQLVYNGAAESGASVTYKLIDSDTNSDDSLALNTKNALINCSGIKITGGKIQIQLNPKSSNPTDGNPYIYSYCLRLFKS